MAATRWLLVAFVLAPQFCVGQASACGEANKKGNQANLPAVLTTPLKSADGDDELRKLQVRHYNTLMTYTAKLYGMGGEDLVPASRRLIRLGLDIRDRPQDRVDYSKQWLEWVQKIHARMTEGGITELQWREFVQELEVEYAKAKRAANKAEK
jgi:hypothetical protein